MNAQPLDTEALLGSRLEVARDEMMQYTSREQFIALGVDILREVGKVTGVLASVYPLDENGQPRRWTRNEAIVGGLVVRLSKLQRGVLGAICDDKLEIAVILTRCLVETAVNIEFLIRFGSDDIHDAYIEYSLREEKRLLNLTDANIKERGQELPIETRMKQSITHWFDTSGVLLASVKEDSRTAWAGTIWDRFKKINGKVLYNTAFTLQSHSVHGNWQDLLLYHLESHDDGFGPMLDWHPAEPEIPTTAAIISANACGWYLSRRLPECQDADRLGDLLAHYIHLSLDVTEIYGAFDGAGFTPPADADADSPARPGPAGKVERPDAST